MNPHVGIRGDKAYCKACWQRQSPEKTMPMAHWGMQGMTAKEARGVNKGAKQSITT